MCVIGGLLGLFVLLGHWMVINTDQSAPPRKWEQFDPQLNASTRSLPDLVAEARRMLPDGAGKRETMNALYWVVINRFTHQEATHTFFGNWILYLMGWLDPAFAHIWDPGLMVERGHSLICDQSSYLLLTLALSQGIEARHVGLNGHVVMEAWFDSDWHMYDPDLEVVPLDPYGRMLSVEELASTPKLLEKYYGPHGVQDIIASREDNTYVSYPAGARFEWKANLLALLEQWMEVAKFLLPALLFAAGIGLTNRQAGHQRKCGIEPGCPDR
jgi:hypothetical protein